MFDVSICIVSYNTRDLLKQCLDSIYSETKEISFEIFAVDNASSDGTVEMLKDHFPNVQLIANKKNLGFATANNQAIKYSKGRYVLLLNPDTLILDSALVKLVEFMDSHQEAGVVGPQILNPDRTFQFSYDDGISLGLFFRGLVISNFSRLLGLLAPVKKHRSYSKNSKGVENPPKIKEVVRVRGCCLLVRKEVVSKVGLMDEQFFMYCEEVDWEYRMKKAGWKIYFYPFAQIIHYWGASSKQNAEKCRQIQHRSNYKYIRKHCGIHGAVLLRCMEWIDRSFKLAGSLKRRLEKGIAGGS